MASINNIGFVQNLHLEKGGQDGWLLVPLASGGAARGLGVGVGWMCSFSCLIVGICGWLDFGEGRQVKHLPWTPRLSLQPGLTRNMEPGSQVESQAEALLPCLILLCSSHSITFIIISSIGANHLYLAYILPFLQNKVFKTNVYI